jgi:uncharacterized Zn-binding protein involved in type VI secretion
LSEEKKEGIFSANVPSVGGSVGYEKKKEPKHREWGDLKPDPSKPPEKGPKKAVAFGPVVKTKDLEGRVWSTKEKGSEEKTYLSVLEGKAGAELISGSYDLAEKKAKLTVVDAKAEGVLVHGQVDLVDKIKQLLFGKEPKPAPPPAAPSAPMAARLGDLTMHGFPLVGGPASPDVFIGGLPAWRASLDIHACPRHGCGLTVPGEPTVLVNGAPAARASDFVAEVNGGPDVIALGCVTVLIGKLTPPPKEKPAEKEKDPWVILESVASGDIGKVSAQVEAGGEVDLKERKGKVDARAGAMAYAAKGELPLKLRIRIPFTSHYVGLGVAVEGSVSAGAEAHAGVKVNDGKKFFEGTAGAKAGLGLGVGLKFGLDISKK